MKRIVVTGAECTGKTTLVRALADRFDAPWVPEAARVFVEREGRAMVAADVPAVTALFARLRDHAETGVTGPVFYDTDLLSTVAYARHYFGGCPPDVVQEARRRAADLYVLAADDIPWTAEPDQRGDEADREAVQTRVRAMLSGWGLAWIEVAGPLAERVRVAERAIDRLLDER